MKFDILTLFPGMFDGPFAESIIKRAVDDRLIEIRLHNIRDYARDRHQTADDYPYGGGAGMVMKLGTAGGLYRSNPCRTTAGTGDTDDAAGPALFACLGRRTCP